MFKLFHRACSFRSLVKSFIIAHSLLIRHNAITELIGTERFPNLKALNLSYNSIFDVEKLLKELSKFEALERLDIRYNGFNADFNFETLIPPNVMSRSIEAIDK